jgi:hypothetical protein
MRTAPASGFDATLNRFTCARAAASAIVLVVKWWAPMPMLPPQASADDAY